MKQEMEKTEREKTERENRRRGKGERETDRETLIEKRREKH